MNVLSPAPSPATSISDLSDEELDRYFATCVPLSNLPTPPPARDVDVDVDLQDETSAQSDVRRQTEALTKIKTKTETDCSPECKEQLAYAAALCNLIPSNISTHRPCPSVVLNMLLRADLPPEMIAFAACLLDALSQRFGSTWHATFSRANPSGHVDHVDHVNQHQPTAAPAPPELVVLASLALAHGFLDDCGRTNSYWARVGTRASSPAVTVTASDVDLAKACVLRDVDYRLFGVSQEMVELMARRMRALVATADTATATARECWPRKESLASWEEGPRPRTPTAMPLTGIAGVALWVNGVATPEPSP